MAFRLRWSPLVAAGALSICFGTVQTAGNTVPATKLGENTAAITPNTLKPTECSAISLTAKRSGSGVITGTSASELITGSAALDVISGSNGNDCILGGAGTDSLNGGPGTDVCIGGPDTDTFNSSCEIQIQ